jgi:hypothetical protein
VELITSGETLDFLSKSAPRPWVKRMLLWMLFVDELAAYSLEGRSIAKTRAFSILLDVLKHEGFGPRREELIRENFNADFAEKLIAAKEGDEFEEVVHEWKRGDEPEQVSCGFFVFAENINWEEGVMRTTIYGKEQRIQIFSPMKNVC